MDILGAILKIVVAMGLGFFLYKRHILNDESNDVMSRMISLGAAPCMIFSSVLSLDAGRKGDVYILLVGGIGLIATMAILAFIAARFLSPDKKTRGVYEAMLTFGNSAFLAFPIGQALMGDLGVSYLAILNIHQSVFAWSYGVFQLTKGNEGKAKFSLKKLLNPPIISAVLAIVLYLIGVSVPDIIMEPISFIGQICSPLSMVVMGATIASFSIKNLFNNWRYYVLSVLKLLVVPLIIFAFCYAIWGQCDITKVMVIHCAMPTAVIITMIAMIFDADYKTTSAATGLMDIMCIGTIPAVWAIINLFA